MNELQFSSEERETLRELLTHSIEELDHEVFHTDTREFKEKLRRRREMLEHILSKIAGSPVPA